MNFPFIRMMTDSYYEDCELKKLNLWTDKETGLQELNFEMIGLLNNLSLEDKEQFISLHEDYDSRDQQQILYKLIENYLSENYNLYNDDIDLTQFKSAEEFRLNYHSESLLLGTGLGILSILVAMIVDYKSISRAGWNILSNFNELNKKIANYINKKTLSGKVKKAIFINNIEKCYRKCGVKKEDVTSWAGFALNKNNMIPEKDEEQAKCLINCYLEWVIENVGFLAESYANCLKGTGSIGFDLNDITAVLSRPPSGHICKSYFDLLKDHHDMFKETLDVIYDTNQKKDEWIHKYNISLSEHLKLARNKEFNRPINKEFNKNPLPNFNKRR